MAKSSGIYLITCTKNKRVYVGGAVNIFTRWNSHRLKLNNGKHWIEKLQADWKKYGSEHFSFSVAEECGISELNDRENHWLAKLKPWVTGYNTRKDSASRQSGIKHKHNRKKKPAQSSARVKEVPVVTRMVETPEEFHDARSKQLAAARDALAQKYTDSRPARMDLFIAELCIRGIILRACEASGLNRRTAYDWKETFPEFNQRWEDALESAADRMEEEAARRAQDGVLKDVYHQGEVVGQERIYSDSLIMFMLKGMRPHKFRENVNVTGGLSVMEPTRIYLPSNGREVVTVKGKVVDDDKKGKKGKGILP